MVFNFPANLLVFTSFGGCAATPMPESKREETIDIHETKSRNDCINEPAGLATYEPGLQKILPSRLRFESVTQATLKELRSINSVLFPMAYHDKYYKEVLSTDGFARMIYWQGRLVGSFSCRVQAFHLADNYSHLECYIMTFGVLAPYRRLRIGSEMLRQILYHYGERAQVRRFSLHVHTINKVALEFYMRHGFSIQGTVNDYYRKLSPTTGYLLVKNIVQ